MGKAAVGYVKVARTLALILLITAPFISFAVAQSSSPGSLTILLAGSKVDTYCTSLLSSLSPVLCGINSNTVVFVEGNLTTTGTYKGPVYLQGTIKVDLSGLLGAAKEVSWTWTSGFTVDGAKLPDSGYFSRTSTASNQISFYNQEPFPGTGWTVTYYQGTVNAYGDPNHTQLLSTGTLIGGGGGPNPTYTLAIQLPLINDTMLGATVNATDSQGNPSPILPANFGGIYNFIMITSFVILVVGVAVALFTNLGGREKGGGLSSVLMMAVTSMVLMVVFPILYNEVAQLVNYMTKTIIAYPNPPNYSDVNIQQLWGAATSNTGISWDTIAAKGLIAIAVWVMELIAKIMIYFIGTGRILLLSAMIAGFPLAVGLRMIPFAGKLGQMVEDTLFGLILAAIMSAVVAAVGLAFINSSSWINTALGSPNWIAIATIFLVILMPTIFAPLTAMAIQTMSQAAIVGGGFAAALGTGVGAPAVTGAAKAIGPAAGALKTGLAEGAYYGGGGVTGALKGLGWGLQSGLTTFGSRLKELNVPQAVLQNAAVIGTAGLASALGATQASKTMYRILPSAVGPADIQQASVAAQDKGIFTGFAPNLGQYIGNASEIAEGLSPAVVKSAEPQARGYLHSIEGNPVKLADAMSKLSGKAATPGAAKLLIEKGGLNSDSLNAGSAVGLAMKLNPAFAIEVGDVNQKIFDMSASFVKQVHDINPEPILQAFAGRDLREEASKLHRMKDADYYIHHSSMLTLEDQARLEKYSAAVQNEIRGALHPFQEAGSSQEYNAKLVGFFQRLDDNEHY